MCGRATKLGVYVCTEERAEQGRRMEEREETVPVEELEKKNSQQKWPIRENQQQPGCEHEYEKQEEPREKEDEQENSGNEAMKWRRGVGTRVKAPEPSKTHITIRQTSSRVSVYH